ncbi:MAG: metallophosphatase family protein [Bacteroidales bacterium]|nr:metallophosphatase family protein [Bacteroidales bacterium]
MKIGIISDTHGYIHPELAEFFKGCDEIWHAGDIGRIEVLEELQYICPKVRAVYGNCDDWDIRDHTTESLVFQCEGHKVAIMHIVGNGSYYSEAAQKLINEEHPTIFIAGHSHILKVLNDTRNRLMFINPGSASRYGHHIRLTFMRLDINGTELSNLEIYDEEK